MAVAVGSPVRPGEALRLMAALIEVRWLVHSFVRSLICSLSRGIPWLNLNVQRMGLGVCGNDGVGTQAVPKARRAMAVALARGVGVRLGSGGRTAVHV